MLQDREYQQKLQAEAALWGQIAAGNALLGPPDWQFVRHQRDHSIMHAQDIDRLLSLIQPGMKVLELGCASGWLTLAMAERGADATGMDISESALGIAQSYYESIRERISGKLHYQVADLNRLELPANTYDLIAVKGTLHHLVELEHVVRTVYDALKPGGLFWVRDVAGDEAPLSVLIAGGLCLVLPTQTSYADKIKALLKFGVNAPSRVRASIQADGHSPFEGAGREHDWLALVYRYFDVELRSDEPAFTGYVTAQVKMPDAIALPLLRALHRVDSQLVRWKLLKNTGVVLHARKRA